ncbi:cytoadherence linked asexual protein 9 [Plasmodium sp. DRC-Itaito]|nr:cytoadherence linked asexual protein 9 [Plasmodium sp. DRC-Itaito]
MIIWFIQPTIFYIIFILARNIQCTYKGDNINEIKSILDNDELYNSLSNLENLLLQTLEQDELKIPIMKGDLDKYLNMSNFKILNVLNADGAEKSYIIPTPNCSANDIVKYEHTLKTQITLEYKPEISDMLKRKNIVVRTLKIIKFMQTPMNAYKDTNNIKQSLLEMNKLFTNKEKKLNEHTINALRLRDRIFNINKLTHRAIKKGISTYMPIEMKSDIIDYDDLLFTNHPSIELMENLDKLANYYHIGIFNMIGSHYIAVGHFITLKLALKNYRKYFEIGNLKYLNWQSILKFNQSDRFKVLDLICDESSSYEGQMKRREQYLKNNIFSTSEECSVLEFLIHHMNKYQMELYSNVHKLSLNVQILLENKHLKEKFLQFMCRSRKECNIYESERFKQEQEKGVEYHDNNNYKFSQENDPASKVVDPFNIFINYFYFIKYYSVFNSDHIIYMHLLNFVGILNGNNDAYVSSLYLPGYYNAIQLSYKDQVGLKDLYQNLVKCVEKCYMRNRKNRSFSHRIASIFRHKKFDSSKCSICEGTLLYINNQSQDKMSMAQKFYIYVTKILKVNNISFFITNMDIYEDYSNYLMHDLNWYTFLFLFRMTTYKDIPNYSISNAMYLSIKDEDDTKRTMVTFHWIPSTIKRMHNHRIKKYVSTYLLEELEKLIDNKLIEKVKKCITFLIHLNAFLQLDFFNYLNETPTNLQHPFPLSMMVEARFKDWFVQYLTGFFFINYDDSNTRYNMPENMKRGTFIPPKYSKWNIHIKRFIDDAFFMYFNQKHALTLFKYHNPYNISNKIMLMRDTFELYTKNYDQLIFGADIMLLRKTFACTPMSTKVWDRVKYFFHNIIGNPINYYKHGLIYAYTLNKPMLKEVVKDFFVIYKMNKDLFSGTSFLQTVYLLFKKIQGSYFSHRRNDDVSMNNIFMFNVEKNYSKMNQADREREIHESMASRFFAKTLFTVFQMMFVIHISNDVDKLDRIYGKADMLRLSVHDEPFLRFAYAYYGSMYDKLTNVFFPMHIKKPTIQLKYGKTFIMANMYYLCSVIFSMYNLNNLGLLCEYQAVGSSNFHSYKKTSQFIDKKFIPLVFYTLKARTELVMNAKNWYNMALNDFSVTEMSTPWPYLGYYMGGNMLYRNILYFPNHLPEELRKQTKGVELTQPEYEPSVHSIDWQVGYAISHGLALSFFTYGMMRAYAYFENVIFFLRNSIRIFDRFYSVLENYVCMYIKRLFNKLTVDKLLKAMSRAYTSTKKEGAYEEAMVSRVRDKENVLKEVQEDKGTDITSLPTFDIMDFKQNTNYMYNDNEDYFDDLDDNEQFLNSKDLLYYDDGIDRTKRYELIPLQRYRYDPF